MMRGDKKELYNKHERLLKYSDQAKDICNDLSQLAVGKAAKTHIVRLRKLQINSVRISSPMKDIFR